MRRDKEFEDWIKSASREEIEAKLKEVRRDIVNIEKLRAELAQQVPIHQTDEALELGRVDPDFYRKLFRKAPL